MNPRDLPIYRIKSDLLDALKVHPVVVIEGPTGCGKTTQVPQILRDSGAIPDDMLIGVTQPRRIAAIGVAERIAFERGEEIGGEVAHAIRFDDRSTPRTRIKVMTDGLLLQEARTDQDFSRYGVIMVDEAHERSLNIDFTLGLLRRVIDRRPDLHLVISSATINAKIFSMFFNGAPRLRVEAETFPVTTRWRPIESEDFGSRVTAVTDEIERIHMSRAPGDALVFLTGEAEIKAVMQEIDMRHLRGVEVLPLYGRLTREEQQRVFDEFPGRRKVVLATNIAETSITIDGIRFVVDLGLAKVPSYDPRTSVSTLHEQPISKASARQRLGRAGRTAPGECIRLYDERDFNGRPAYLTEEILRMDLSEVVLRMIDLGIHDVEAFPFVTRPPRDQLLGAVKKLRELGAIDHRRELTEVGRRMVPFPLAPRLSRMIVAAADQCPDVLDEVLTAGALLSVRWPQVLPPGEEDEAREAHRTFSHDLGDLAAGLDMVAAFRRARNKETFCERHYLDPVIMGELLLVHEQLSDIARAAGVKGGRGGHVHDVLKCVATAFTRNIARRLGNSPRYETATGVQVQIHPGSCLFQKRPEFIVAADLVVTGRPWARQVSALKAQWIPKLDPDLAERWRITRRKGDRDDGLPQAVSLYGQKFKVRKRRGIPTIEVPWQLIRKRGDEPPPPDLARLGVWLTLDGDRVLKDVTVDQARSVVLALQIEDAECRSWGEGEVYEADRDLHHILRRVPDLLRRAESRRRRRSGFLTLIHNGAGGYWFDVSNDLRLAVEQSHLALTHLAGEPTLNHDDQLALSEVSARVSPLARALQKRPRR